MENEGCLFTVLVVVFLAVAMAIGYAFGNIGCTGRWRDSGLPWKYELVGGCKVSPDGGRTWIPDDRYREMAP
jgi:hypothetical protein